MFFDCFVKKNLKFCFSPDIISLKPKNTCMSELSRVFKHILSIFCNRGNGVTWRQDSLHTPAAARLWKSSRLGPDRTAGKQLNTDRRRFSFLENCYESVRKIRSRTNWAGLTSEFPGGAVGRLLLGSGSGSVGVRWKEMSQNPNEGAKVQRFLSGGEKVKYFQFPRI